MSNEMELKAYKMLSEIYGNLFRSARNIAMNCVEYKQGKPDEVMKQMEHIANPGKWGL